MRRPSVAKALSVVLILPVWLHPGFLRLRRTNPAGAMRRQMLRKERVDSTWVGKIDRENDQSLMDWKAMTYGGGGQKGTNWQVEGKAVKAVTRYRRSLTTWRRYTAQGIAALIRRLKVQDL
ncbi:hypothetical protein Bbelb_428500 [Branchiostoma belcheri]|nr:hypothetical protein Bbelb_428500 [Branchiostoma belcheri]